MSAVAVAIVGGAIIGGVAANQAADAQSEAVQAGATTAAGATIVNTELRIAEIIRQFDYQQELLAPLVQQQYAAGSAYMDLLGIGGGPNDPNTPQALSPPPQEDPRLADLRERLTALRRGDLSGSELSRGGGLNVAPGVDPGAAVTGRIGAEIAALEQEIQEITTAPQPLSAPPYPASGATAFTRGPGGEFVDPNLDPRKLADINTLGDEVRGNLLAGTSLEDDVFRQDVAGRSLAGGAAGTDIYGDVFKESPGYAFQVEEMERALERKNSAGGNYGGRALMEALRRAKGLAAGDYYQWAQGRSRDVDRLTGAEASDAARLDATGLNYLQRRAGDASRLDAAAMQEDRLVGTDIQRGDQAYYNYLSNVSRGAGFGDATSQAVGSSSAAGGAVAGAYGAQGGALGNIYNTAGINQANIAGNEIGNYNNIIQGGISNWLAYRNAQPSTTTQPTQPAQISGPAYWT